MRDPQLYKAIEGVRLDENERSIAIAEMERAEGFADAFVWVLNAIGKLRLQVSAKPANRVHALSDRAFMTRG
jgi:hypothetical protein